MPRRVSPHRAVRTTRAFQTAGGAWDSARAHPRLLFVEKTRIVDVSGALTGRYELLEEREDGTVVLSPDTSLVAIRRRLGTEPVSADEFEELFGDLPTGPPPNGGGRHPDLACQDRRAGMG